MGINYEKFKDALYSNTITGWMNQDEFDIWIRCFDEYVTSLHIPKPVILFLDGHSSHLGVEASKYCRDNDIILYCFLANATHILQPFNVGIFSPWKDSWASAVLSWQICNIGDAIMKQNFNVILEMAWRNTTSNENGKAVKLAANAFCKTGIYPFDVSKVDYLCTLTGKQKQNDAKQAYFAMMRKQEPKKADEVGKLKEVPATPLGEVLATPLGEVLATSQAEVLATPQAEVLATPQAEVLATPQAEVLATPQAEVLATPQAKQEPVPSTSRMDPVQMTPSTSRMELVPVTPQVPKSIFGSTPSSSRRPRDENYVTPHMVKLRVPEQRS